MRKFETTFVFVAVLIIAVIGYGISGNFLSDGKAYCESECRSMMSADACFYNGTYYNKDFFLNSVCPQDIRQQCESQLCGTITLNNQTQMDRCMKLCQK